MNIWEILGIEPTRDQGAVRRAYAAAAARYNPEEHPEEFLAVRQAYEQALAFARSVEEPAEVPEVPELTMPAQPLPAMEPESRTAGTGGFTLELEPEGSRQPDFPALERFRELYASKQRRDRKQWDLWFTSPEFLAVYRDPAFTAALHQAVEELKKEFPLCKEFQTALAVAYRYRAIVYQDHTEFELEEGAGFEGLQEILQIAVQGPLVRKFQGNDVTLSVAYADYEELMDLARNGVWNSQTLDQLHWILNRYLMAHLREKSTGNIKTERCVISLRILEFYFDSQRLLGGYGCHSPGGNECPHHQAHRSAGAGRQAGTTEAIRKKPEADQSPFPVFCIAGITSWRGWRQLPAPRYGRVPGR